MSNFKLKREGRTSSTSIPNNFIENFMPTAAGEFVKIYIYLLKCISENCSELSISRIADVFNDTEKDVIRALKYWEKKGLLKLAFDENKELESLVVASDEQKEVTKVTRTSDVSEDPAEVEPEAEPEVSIPESRQYSRAEVETFSAAEDNRLLIYAVQKLIGRQLTGADINTIMFLGDSLGFSEDLIEYLFEYCAEKGKTSRRYIEKTGIAWATQGIKDVKGAKLMNALYSDNCYPVMKAFGLTGRNPAKIEREYIDRWFLSYGFSMEMVLSAIDRTIAATHNPSFEYADSILKKWKSEGITTLDAAAEADMAFSAKKAAKKASSSASGAEKKKKSANSFDSFEQRTYDYDELEEKLVNK